jgi:hypothetical protein
MNALPSITPAQARLPQTYEAARNALSNCASVDECKEWADKAAALASYAKQSEDDTLLKLATRIKARATRRAGELLTQIEPAKFRGNQHVVKAGDHLNRTDAAREAGFSPHQQKQALRVAAVPEPDFEAQVESDTPPTLSKLAQQGVKPRSKPEPLINLKGRDPREFNTALHFLASFERYAKEVEKHSLESVLPILTDAEREELRGYINRIDTMHDRIITRI